MEKWLTVQELLGLETLPKSDRGITKKADRENWVKRQREGVKGKTFEYKFSSLPEDSQAEILLKQNATPVMAEAPKAKKELNYLPEVIWKPYEKKRPINKRKKQKRNSPRCKS